VGAGCREVRQLFSVAAALCECLENGVSLDVIETLCAAAGGNARARFVAAQGAAVFLRELFYVDQALSRQHDGVFNCVLQSRERFRP
jgi:hypothetical protein